MTLELPNPEKLIMKSMTQLLESVTGFKLPENFMQLAQKIKVKDFTTEADKELLTLYGQIEVDDVESLEALQELITPLIEMLKKLGAKKDEEKESEDTR